MAKQWLSRTRTAQPPPPINSNGVGVMCWFLNHAFSYQPITKWLSIYFILGLDLLYISFTVISTDLGTLVGPDEEYDYHIPVLFTEHVFD